MSKQIVKRPRPPRSSAGGETFEAVTQAMGGMLAVLGLALIGGPSIAACTQVVDSRAVGQDAGTAAEDDAATNASEEGVPPEEFRSAYVHALCERQVECCDRTVTVARVSKCVEAYRLRPWNSYDDPSWEDPRHLAYSRENAALCLDRVRSTPCSLTLDQHEERFAPCSSVVTGTLAEGEPGCRTTLDCAPGLYCDAERDQKGSCLARSGQGQSCSGWPVATRATAPKKERDDEAIHRAHERCGAGQYCAVRGPLNGGTAEGVCQPEKRRGEACVPDQFVEVCTRGSMCIGGRCEPLFEGPVPFVSESECQQY